jgi:hypothetical protein
LAVRHRQLVWDNPMLSSSTLEHYLSLELELDPLLGSDTGQDPWLPQARQTHPGLRPLRSLHYAGNAADVSRGLPLHPAERSESSRPWLALSPPP